MRFFSSVNSTPSFEARNRRERCWFILARGAWSVKQDVIFNVQSKPAKLMAKLPVNNWFSGRYATRLLWLQVSVTDSYSPLHRWPCRELSWVAQYWTGGQCTQKWRPSSHLHFWAQVCGQQRSYRERTTLYILDGPCHLSSFKQCSRDIIFPWGQLIYSSIDK